ncbi:MAG: hypothetical protein NTY22_07570 [Proteobacteria bacterium]|nr:hypothetical protein [Pseudomonadota bacterium]
MKFLIYGILLLGFSVMAFAVDEEGIQTNFSFEAQPYVGYNPEPMVQVTTKCDQPGYPNFGNNWLNSNQSNNQQLMNMFNTQKK